MRSGGGPEGGGAPGAQATGPVPGFGWTESSLLLMVLVWGVNFSVVKRALEAFTPLGFNALRFALASAVVWAVLRAQGRLVPPDRADVSRLILLGIVGNLLYQLAFIFGLNLTLAAHASLILALTPVFTVLLSAWKGHEAPGPRSWIGTLLAFLGVALVTGSAFSLEGSRAVLMGDLIMLGGCFTWSVYTVGARGMVRKYGSIPVTAWTLWAGTVGLILIGIPDLARQDWSRVGPVAWGGMIFSGACSIALAYLLWYRGVERLGNTRTAVFSNLTPVVAILFAAVWLGERLTVLGGAGAAVTLAGVLVVRSDRS